MTPEIEKMFCSIVAISNIVDDLIDINEDYEKGVSIIAPS
jgi:hypothetical protein